MRLRRGSTRWACVLAILSTLSCSSKTAAPAPQEPPLDLNEQTQKGWDLFRSRNYTSSASVFRRLIVAFPDAPAPYIGLGWCDVERDSLNQALDLFEHSLRLDSQVDALSGVVVSASALGRDSLAVHAAYQVRDTGYVFDGRPTFGYAQVVYLRALGEFHLLRWEDCYASLRILDPELDVDLAAWDFREQLFAALQALRNAA